MVFKINIGTAEGKTYKLENESKALIEKSVGETIPGKDVDERLEGYELEITGASDKSGFPALKTIEGHTRKKALLSYEPGMFNRPKYEGKKKRSDTKPKGLRLRKTVRGKIIGEDINQINLKVVKQGSKTLKEIFEAPAETPAAE